MLGLAQTLLNKCGLPLYLSSTPGLLGSTDEGNELSQLLFGTGATGEASAPRWGNEAGDHYRNLAGPWLNRGFLPSPCRAGVTEPACKASALGLMPENPRMAMRD